MPENLAASFIWVATGVVAEDFDRARQEMLARFRELILVHPEAAQIEATTTADLMRQLLILEGAVDA